MKVTDIEQIAFLAVDPALLGQRLTFGAMAVTTGIVGDLREAALMQFLQTIIR
jgi:hypothetical protein